MTLTDNSIKKYYYRENVVATVYINIQAKISLVHARRIMHHNIWEERKLFQPRRYI